MKPVAQRIRSFLKEHGIEYETLHHQRDYTAQETAAHTHTPGREFAKAVVLRVGEEYAMAVLPSHHVLDPEKLAGVLGGQDVGLASEEEIQRICVDCEVGAVPPFGNLYGLPVYVSPELAANERITCVAGSHADVIRLAYRDFETSVKPISAELSVLHRGPESEGPARGSSTVA